MSIPSPSELPRSLIDWPQSVRIVSSRYPPVGVFDDVASPEDLDWVLELESQTNERLTDEAGDLALVEPADRIAGPGTTPIMAAFTHPALSRFSAGEVGVYYCAASPATAIAETVYHRERFLRQGGFEPIDLEMREYLAPLQAHLHDLRGLRSRWPAVYDPHDYTAPQALGDLLRAESSWGVVYNSVREPAGGECAGVFRPPALTGPCVQGRHFYYRWDGEKIAAILEVSEITVR